jgi:predicted transcriptional regulator
MDELTPEQQESIREAVRNDPEFMAGVREGLKARAEGRVTPWSEVKKELDIK